MEIDKVRGRRAIHWSLLLLSVGAFVLIALQAARFFADWMLSSGDFNEARWVFLSPWGTRGIALAAVLCLVIIMLSWASSVECPTRRRRIAVICARTVAVSAAFLLFAQPALERSKVVRKPNRIAVLMDDSSSMQLPVSSGNETRAAFLRSVIADSFDVFESLRDERGVDFFRFSTDLFETTAVEPATSLGAATRVRDVLLAIAKRYEAGALAGVILLSDGEATGALAEPTSGEIEQLAAQLAVPIHTVWLAEPNLPDISIAEVRADEFAFARTRVEIAAVIRTKGFASRAVPVTLTVDGQVVKTRSVFLNDSRPEATVTFAVTPEKVGKFVYEISVPAQEGEVVLENNREVVLVRVIRDKIRVLHVAGQPSWDVRALRGMLKQNPNVDLISFFILRTADDASNASQGELSLIPFPTEELFSEELPSFDVVFLQNFNYGPYRMGRYLTNIADYVLDGGGLVMLGGPLSFSSGGYANTPLAPVLPLRLQAYAGGLFTDETFRPLLTDAGKKHPVTQLRFERARNEKAWSSAPSLEGTNTVLGLQREAVALVEHPTKKSDGGERQPVIAAMDAGKGRTLAVATDSLWRWQFRPTADVEHRSTAYQKLWENAVRWLTRDPEFERLKIVSDALTYRTDEVVALSIRALDSEYRPMGGTRVHVELREGAEPASAEVRAGAGLTTGDGGVVTYELGLLPPGIYRAVAEMQLDGRTVVARELFSVQAGARETEHPNPRPRLLRGLSGASGGSFLTRPRAIPNKLKFLRPQVSRVDRHETVEVWSGIWLLLLALVALAIEWGLRQRSNAL